MDVDRATFDDCPYTPEHILSLESDPDQYAWVAEESGRIVGFVSAFATYSLAASRWEVDELAVHPQAQGRGIGTALVARALEEGVNQAGLTQARALVAVDNGASARVFSRCGFSPVFKVDLMLYSIVGREPRPLRDEWPTVRRAESDDLVDIAELGRCDVVRAANGLGRSKNVYLVAGSERGARAYVELLHVRTLQYEGFWVESMGLAQPEEARWARYAASALLSGAIEEAKRRESMDEVGYLASPDATAV